MHLLIKRRQGTNGIITGPKHIYFCHNRNIYVFHSSGEAAEILNDFINSVTVIDIDRDVKQRTIKVRKNTKLKLPDSIIAASACVHNIPFISADKSFKKVNELNLIYYNLPVND